MLPWLLGNKNGFAEFIPLRDRTSGSDKSFRAGTRSFSIITGTSRPPPFPPWYKILFSSNFFCPASGKVLILFKFIHLSSRAFCHSLSNIREGSPPRRALKNVILVYVKFLSPIKSVANIFSLFFDVIFSVSEMT